MLDQAIRTIKPLNSRALDTDEVCMALMCAVGARSPLFPATAEGDYDYGAGWTMFDPELVEPDEVNDLPHPWDQVYAKHHAPGYQDCVSLRYRYVHCPVPVTGSYPAVPLRGVFVVTNRAVTDPMAKDLIHLGPDAPKEV